MVQIPELGIPCEVCGEAEAAIVRQCSLPIPYSAAYCDSCATMGVEPLALVNAAAELEAAGTIEPLPAGAREVIRRSRDYFDKRAR